MRAPSGSLALLWLFVTTTLVTGDSRSSPNARSARATRTRTTRAIERPLAKASDGLKTQTTKKLDDGKRLNRKERKEVAQAELATYKDLRRQGVDEVSNTAEAALLRNYRLRNKKTRGIIRKKEASLAQVLFPGVSPEEYNNGEQLWMYVDLVESSKTQVPFEFYDLPGCKMPTRGKSQRTKKMRKNLGSRLQGHDMKPAPFDLTVKRDMGCTPICQVALGGKKLRWMRKLVERQYRVQLQLDTLPVLMRSKELNYAVRGYPIGFKAPPSTQQTAPKNDYFLYNHLKFQITYHEDPSQFDGVRITGFDVHPVSVKHEMPANGGAVSRTTQLSTCKGMNVENDAANFLSLKFQEDTSLNIVYSYDVQWIKNDLAWTDRWDVYLVGSPDDGIHYYSILNSLFVVVFMTGAIASIMVRTLRKDIQGYNELQTLEEAQEETGWKLVHGDVFRPPSFSPMLLSIIVGTGAQIGSAFVCALLCSILRLTNSMKKGQILSSLIFLYVLLGSIG